MARNKPRALLKRAKKRWQEKRQWRDLYEDCYELAMPNRNPWGNLQKGGKKNERVYDSTPINSTQRFATRLQTQMTPPFERWFDLKSGPSIPDGAQTRVDRELDAIVDVAAEVFNTGNFNAAIHEFYLDLSVGTAAMLILEGDNRSNPVRFIAVPQHRVAFGEGPFNTIDSIYRKHEIPARLVEKRWPDADVPPEIKEKAEEVEDEDDEFDLWEVTYEETRTETETREITNEEGEVVRTVEREVERDVWYYEVLFSDENENDDESPERIVERAYRTNPWVITRWSKNAGENRGRGPLVSALPDIKTLNKAKELILKNASLAISAPLMVADDGVTNPQNIKIAPAALIPVARNAGPNGPSIQPLEMNRNFDVGQLVIEDLRQTIKKMLFNEQLPPLEQKTPKSATEIVERMKALSEDIGGSFGRLYLELIKPMVQRVLQILFDKGLVGADINLDDLAVRLQVVSPLARAQNLNDVSNILQWLQILQTFAGPQGMAMSAKLEQIFEELASKLGVPASMVRSDTEREQLAQQIAQMAQQGQGQPGVGQRPQGQTLEPGSPGGGPPLEAAA